MHFRILIGDGFTSPIVTRRQTICLYASCVFFSNPVGCGSFVAGAQRVARKHFVIRLSGQDLEACSQAVRALYTDASPAEFPKRALATLSKLVAVEHLTYNEIALQPRKLVAQYFPERPE